MSIFQYSIQIEKRKTLKKKKSREDNRSISKEKLKEKLIFTVLRTNSILLDGEPERRLPGDKYVGFEYQLLNCGTWCWAVLKLCEEK